MPMGFQTENDKKGWRNYGPTVFDERGVRALRERVGFGGG
jgi:hypothetical protein